MVRIRPLIAPSMVFAAACAAGAPTSPGGPGDPSAPAGSRPVTPNDQTAVGLGMAVLSSDAAGAPRLMRSIRPRAAAAGTPPAQAARDHVSALAPLWLGGAAAMPLVETGTQRLRSGATVVRLAQQIDGVVAHDGELRVMMNPDGSLAAVSGTLRPAVAAPGFGSSASVALDRALDELYGTARPHPAITAGADQDGWQALVVASGTALRVSSARARRELATIDGQPAAAWSIEVLAETPVDPSTPATAHRLLIGDASGRIVDDVDLIQHDAFAYRAYAETTGNRRPFDGPLQSVTPHPTGIPDGSFPAPVAANLVVVDSFNQPLDKWLPDDATTTSGNNVVAFADLDGTQTFTDGDLRPEVRAGRVLNYTYDLALDPLATPDQSKAGAVNAFFVTNWMHDWWYDSGFTEATGNAQVDNYGRGGVAGDPLIVFAQMGARTALRNTAFTTTPADGVSPRISVLLWQSPPVTTVTTPSGPIAGAAFSTGPNRFELTGDLVEVDDKVGSPNDACEPLVNDLTGKIALATFTGACGSFDMIDHVQAAGATGVLLVDTIDDPEPFGGDPDAVIPGVVIGQTAGAALLEQLRFGQTVTVTMASGPDGVERDGDLDNSTLAHEWGHYLHHRLATCNSRLQCTGMSEGWGDFNALLMMLRDGDRREGTYAVATYATGNATSDGAYFGIRRFPYSIDRSKNDLSFRHVSDGRDLPTATPANLNPFPNSEPHNAGEVWASMLWESFNALIDAHDVATARRRISDYVVAGLLLTPPDATFTEGRDALLAAAGALDSDDMLLIAAAFAGRGLGSCAVAPSNDEPGNPGVIESGTLAGKLELGGLHVSDDGVSCDHDGILDPGESGMLHATVVNAGPVAAEQVTVTATTTNAGVRIGAPIVLPLLAAVSSVDVAIPVTVLASAPRATDLAISVRVTAEQVCDRGGVALGLTVPTGIDEVANASTVDHFETSVTPWTTTGDAAVWNRQVDATRNHVWFATDAAFVSDGQLVSPLLTASVTEPLVVTISHAYDLEASRGQLFDGGVIELSFDRGVSWLDVTAFGVDPGYTGTIFVGDDSPLAGRSAFSGTSPGFPALRPLTLDFGTLFGGKSVQLRFRLGTDRATARTGWIIDDVAVHGITNTPFPAVVPEPSTCVARRAEADDDLGGVVATSTAPATRLAAFDAVCARYE
jgi:hypothetical protein